MIELAYTSTASWLYSGEDIATILEISRRNNARDGITGILLYKSGSIMQLLEGEPDALRRLYAKLLGDVRHHQVTKLYERPLAARSFSQWSMAFEAVDGLVPLAPDLHQLSYSSSAPFADTVTANPRVQRLLDLFLSSVR